MHMVISVTEIKLTTALKVTGTIMICLANHEKGHPDICVSSRLGSACAYPRRLI